MSETNQLDMQAEGVFVSSLCKAERIGLAMMDQDGIFIMATPKFHEFLEIGSGIDITDKSLREVLEITDLRDDKNNPLKDVGLQFIDRVVSPIREKRKGSKCFLAMTRNSKIIQLNIRFTPHGRAIFCARDISNERRYKELLDMSMDAADAGFWSMRFDTGEFEYSESVTKRLNADEVEKMQKYGLFSIIHNDDLSKITRQWQNIVSGEAPFDMTYRVVTQKDGEMWQRSMGKVRRSPDGSAIGATAFVMNINRDVESRDALVQEREASKAKSEFLARMSHEIRTPLNAIIGMSDSLYDEELSDDVRDVVKDIEEAAEGLHNLLSRTLDHAKLISNKMQVDLDDVRPAELVETCAKLWRPQIASKGLTFRSIIAPDVPETLLLDGFRLQQCINNLLSNAVKFTQEGEISLILRMVKRQGQDTLVIAIRDTGIGMDEAQAKKVFEPFVQADESISRQFGGTGLGMSITKQLCELMGGQTHLRSEPGQGSTFMLLIPIVASVEDIQVIRGDVSVSIKSAEASHQARKLNVTNEVSQATVPQAERPVFRNKEQRVIPAVSLDNMKASEFNPEPFEGLAVLCVEDNPVNQRVVKRLIGGRVAQLYFANNGREALNMLNSVNVDVILMDIHMPVMDGIETTLQIRQSGERYANVIIIALTADPDYQQKRICKNIGMNDTIAKPVRREDILGAFDRTLGKLSEDFGQKVALSA